jgi:uncharacterized protein (TIGR00369 family)
MPAKSLIEKYIEQNAFGKFVGMSFNILEPGTVEYHLTVQQQHMATPLAAHGGVIASLIDGALGVAALSLVYEQNKVVSTVEYKLNYLGPALLNDHLTARAKVEHRGKRILIVSCDLYCLNRQNKLLAKALGTFNSYDAVKAGY